jgi:hypothetical protein
LAGLGYLAPSLLSPETSKIKGESHEDDDCNDVQESSGPKNQAKSDPL